jgi:hypothetical protein
LAELKLPAAGPPQRPVAVALDADLVALGHVVESLGVPLTE